MINLEKTGVGKQKKFKICSFAKNSKMVNNIGNRVRSGDREILGAYGTCVCHRVVMHSCAED